jgi:tRNA-modifying protein YgfZ
MINPTKHYSWIPSGAVRVTGSDRIPFVHGQSTNDVRGLPTPGAQRALILNAKGQIEYDVRVFKRQDDLYLQTAPGLGSEVLERLKRYVVFDDVQLDDITDKIRVVHLSGETILEVASKLGFDPAGTNTQQFSNEIGGTLLALKIDRGPGMGLDIHVLASKADELQNWLEILGLRHLANLEHARILAGIPDAHTDQEIMARLEARGHTNRELVRVIADRKLEPGTALFFEGRSVGFVGASVPRDDAWLALAVLRKDVPDEALLESPSATLKLERLDKTARA